MIADSGGPVGAGRVDLTAANRVVHAREWTIIGIGNVFRGDDAVGLHLIRHLKPRLDPAVTVAALHDTVAPLLDYLAPGRHLLLMDAVRGLSSPGSIYEIDLLALPREKLPPIASNHLIDLPTIIGLAEAVGQLPASLTLFGIEAACVDRGAPLSAPVLQAMPSVLVRVEHRIAARPV